MNTKNEVLAQNNKIITIKDKQILLDFINSDAEVLSLDIDFNFLMEVVEKIEGLNYFIQIDSIGVVISKEKKIITVSDNRSKIENVYNACLEFIKWYNEQK